MAQTRPTATYDDVTLMLRLYELRREDRMRRARAWFTASFYPATLEELNTLCPPGSEENASFRMVATYWDMVASFITGGVLHQELFFESGRELLLVWIRVEPFLAGFREVFKDPHAFGNLEKVAAAYIDWLNQRAPGSYDAFRTRLGRPSSAPRSS